MFITFTKFGFSIMPVIQMSNNFWGLFLNNLYNQATNKSGYE